MKDRKEGGPVTQSHGREALVMLCSRSEIRGSVAGRDMGNLVGVAGEICNRKMG